MLGEGGGIQFCKQDAFFGSIGTKLGVKGRLGPDEWSVSGELGSGDDD